MLSAVVVTDLGHTEGWLVLAECKGLFEASCVFAGHSALKLRAGHLKTERCDNGLW